MCRRTLTNGSKRIKKKSPANQWPSHFFLSRTALCKKIRNDSSLDRSDNRRASSPNPFRPGSLPQPPCAAVPECTCLAYHIYPSSATNESNTSFSGEKLLPRDEPVPNMTPNKRTCLNTCLCGRTASGLVRPWQTENRPANSCSYPTFAAKKKFRRHAATRVVSPFQKPEERKRTAWVCQRSR